MDKEGAFLGFITLKDVKGILEDPSAVQNLIVAYDLIEATHRAVTPETSLDDVMKIFSQIKISEIPVVDPQNGKTLLGYVTEKDVIEAYNRELARRELTIGMERAYSSLTLSETTELVDDYYMLEIAAPRRFVGKSLRQLDLRNNYKVQIILIKRQEGDEEKRIVPDAFYTINENDVLLLVGEREALERIKKL